MAINGEFFTVGESPEDTAPMPKAMRRSASVKLRFTRGVEGWRVAAADNRMYLINQRIQRGPAAIASGEVVRLEPGGPGLQFLVRAQLDAAITGDTPAASRRVAPTTPADASTARPPFWDDPATLRWALVVAALATALLAAYVIAVSGSGGEVAPAEPKGSDRVAAGESGVETPAEMRLSPGDLPPTPAAP